MSIRGAKIYGPNPPRDTMTNWALEPLVRGVEFVCPNCGKAAIVRSFKSRKLGIIYRCPACGFEGP
ncbi:MAG: DUF1610 domain-containing protein [Thermoproteus sp.]|nr:DUF1610 domain-containing protein [Thermoproteus sp.]